MPRKMGKFIDKNANDRIVEDEDSDGMPSRKGDQAPFFIWLPCLRCGNCTVPIIPTFFLRGEYAFTFPCRACWAEHYLSVAQEGSTFLIHYQRYTLKYPLEYYDEGMIPTNVRFHVEGTQASEQDSDCYSGPIVVYPRRKHFSQSEVESIWKASKGRCHICNRRWRLDQRGRNGWHIDHVIPHIGGGSETEDSLNFRVACAACNLKKGRGFTESAIRQGLRQLVECLSSATGA